MTRTLTKDELDERICDAIIAAAQGEYDGLTVIEHLQILLEDVRKGL